MVTAPFRDLRHESVGLDREEFGVSTEASFDVAEHAIVHREARRRVTDGGDADPRTHIPRSWVLGERDQ